MKILITGANGQLGKDIQKECEKRAIEYIATDLIPNSTQNPGEKKAKWKPLEITDFKSVRAFVRENPVDVMINCAAYNAVDKAEEDWQTAFLVNAIGPKNLAIVANEQNIPIMHFSTDYVFDGKKGSPYFIWDKPNPISKYGESKLYGEELVRGFTNRYFLIRLSWVFGEGNTNFVNKVLEWSKGKDELRIVDDQTSSPSYTVDLSKAILDLLDTRAYGVYHMSNTGSCSRYEWAKLILECALWKGRVLPMKTSEIPSTATRPLFSALDSFPLGKIIGYELPNWREATKRFLATGEN